MPWQTSVRVCILNVYYLSKHSVDRALNVFELATGLFPCDNSPSLVANEEKEQ